MNIHFAGGDGAKQYNEILKKAGATSRLESYYSLGQKGRCSVNLFQNYLLDSGGYVARNKGIEISVEEYATTIRNWQVPFAFNLDTVDFDETMQNQQYLEKHTDAYIIPIYHASDYYGEHRGLLDDFIDQGYGYVAIGGVAGMTLDNASIHKFFSYVLLKTKDRIRVHGLGITDKKMLQKYPFYSVDSTSWLSMGMYGVGMNIPRPLQKVAAKMIHHTTLTHNEVDLWMSIQQEITELWASRGIIWETANHNILREKIK